MIALIPRRIDASESRPASARSIAARAKVSVKLMKMIRANRFDWMWVDDENEASFVLMAVVMSFAQWAYPSKVGR